MRPCPHPARHRSDTGRCYLCGAPLAPPPLELTTERLPNGRILVWHAGPNWAVCYAPDGRCLGGGGVDRPEYRAAALAHVARLQPR